jgi:putative NADPH-quinone reductase
MKHLIVVSHPNLSKSVINKRWVEELEKYPDLFTVNKLYTSYPDGKINVEKEQQLIEAHDVLVFQYPLYWFNYPSLLKKWLDEVFVYGWAYGSKGDKLKDKKLALAISIGMRKADYQEDGKCKVTIGQLILPFKTTALYSKADFRGYFTLYDSHNVSSDAVTTNAQEYIHYIMNL